MTDPENTIFEHLEEVTAQRPTKPSKLIESLEVFAGFGGKGRQSFFPGLYAFLCDLTHASQRAIAVSAERWKTLGMDGS